MDNSPFPQLANPAQANAPVIVNEILAALGPFGCYAKAYLTTTGLTWGYYGGRWGGFDITAGTLTLDDSDDNYIVVEIATGDISASTGMTDWNDDANFLRIYKVTTGASAVTDIEDHRGGPAGLWSGGGTGGGGGGGAVVGGLDFTASSTTTDSDPGTGKLRWNNSTQASATILYIDNADGDATSLATLWASLGMGAFFKITDAADADVWQLWKVTSAPTNGTGYYKFAVSLQAQEGGNITDLSPIVLDVDASISGLADGDKGDITVSSSGATWTIDNDVVTYAKMQNVSATSRILARKTASAGDMEEATLSEILDFIGSAAHGDVLYRGSSTWARLAAGTAKFMLQTGGAAANPAWVAPTQVIPIACSDETTPLTTGTAKVTFRMPFAFKLTGIRASVTTAPTGTGNLTVDVNESGTTVISTKLTFDASEKTTVTAATPPVISDADLADDAEITVDIDAVSGTITGTGLKVYLIGYCVT